MNKILLITLLSLPIIGTAQQKKVKYISRTTLEGGATLSTNGSMSALALHGAQYWGFGKKKKNFKLGLGARLTSSFGSSSLQYITAPAKFTSGQTGPGVFFAENIPNNIDTVSLNGTQINAFNVQLLLNYHVYKKWSVEFNIDLLGFSLGGSKNAVLQYGDNTKQVATSTAYPTLGNVLLISDNDLGSLNSELKIFYALNKKVKLNGGLSFLFNEYTLDKPVSYINSLGTTINVDRYRTKALMFGVGINYLLK